MPPRRADWPTFGFCRLQWIPQTWQEKDREAAQTRLCCAMHAFSIPPKEKGLECVWGDIGASPRLTLSLLHLPPDPETHAEERQGKQDVIRHERRGREALKIPC